ncbi:MAG: enoyl-CoA hydratase/isomerase family protein [Corynebacterium sp.]|uniref:enoyl-CoA hydratase/isomerase family protein n=1 Tax=Corynebacterium sp. TaxID=1720 RepID=UPI0026DC6867|nr:enoyl-CoA hydratase/isomerase family protein [Corynebacterium sp.]MDO5097245.1 enoyl-CoA hydratase/isomerase family protein [Corynebacterium sp.]
MTDAPEVLTEIRGKAGIITLNRPKAMNALNHNMVGLMAKALKDYQDNDAVELVILQGAGERGLCAGGDIIALYNDARDNGLEGAKFWHDEYQLNLAISEYPKPYVALMTGIVLGGGIGVSAHGSHRIVTDNTRVGMPETGIGFVPDVGGSFLLSHAPDNLGIHLGLTGIHVGAPEAIAANMADYYVPQDDLPALVDKLCQTGSPDSIAEFARPAGEAFDGKQSEITAAYQAGSVAEILEHLDAVDSDWARDAAQRIRRNSPTAVKVTLESIRRAATMSLAEALEEEYRVSNNMHREPDFVEGVRAQVVDKDRNPTWRPATLDEVSDDSVAAIVGELRDSRIPPLNLT